MKSIYQNSKAHTEKAGYNQHTSPYTQKPDSQSIPTTESKIFAVLWDSKKNGRKEATINSTRKSLLLLSKHCNLDSSEDVKAFIASHNVSAGTKRNLCFAYERYVAYHGLSWKRPVYRIPSKFPKIPSAASVDMLIAKSPLKLALAISLSKDTGMRPCEVMNLTVRQVDLEKRLAYPATAKTGCGRVLKFSQSTANLLASYIVKKNLGINDTLFGQWDSGVYGKWFRYHRNKLSAKLNDESIKSVRLYDLRHFFASMFYYKTRDLLRLKLLMGHRKIETTLIYTQFINFEDEEYVCQTASTVEEAKALVEQGFDYICEVCATKLFRKRK